MRKHEVSNSFSEWLYLFDTGYFKIETYDRIVETGNHFVTLLHKKITVEVIEDHPVPSEPLSSGYVVVRLSSRRSP